MRKVTNFIHAFRLALIRAWFKFARPQVRFPRRAILGKNVFFGKGRRIEIGENFFCGRNCHFSCHARIGNDVLVASSVSMVGGDHEIDFISTTINRSGRSEMKEIVVSDNVWIGHGAIILHGVTIASGAVVAAGALVTKDVPENAIVGGNPARLIRYRKMKDDK